MFQGFKISRFQVRCLGVQGWMKLVWDEKSLDEPVMG